MKGEKEFFRKRFFGGFNRTDVIKYIAKIAEERNEAIAAKEKAEKELRALTEEIRTLRGEEINPGSDIAVLDEEIAAIKEIGQMKEEAPPFTMPPFMEESPPPIPPPVPLPAPPPAPPPFTMPPAPPPVPPPITPPPVEEQKKVTSKIKVTRRIKK